MDFDLPPDDHPTRRLVREWVAANPHPTGRQLAEAGYVVPHWPRPWGLEADPIDQLVIDDELAKAGVRRPGQSHRNRMGGADDLPRGHHRAARALPPEDLQR